MKRRPLKNDSLPTSVPFSDEQRKKLFDWLNEHYAKIPSENKVELLKVPPPVLGVLAGYHALGVQEFPGIHGDEIVKLTADWMRCKRAS